MLFNVGVQPTPKAVGWNNGLERIVIFEAEYFGGAGPKPGANNECGGQRDEQERLNLRDGREVPGDKRRHHAPSGARSDSGSGYGKPFAC
jgi:hypothetical protein